MALTRVFEPISIGKIQLPNRIARAAHDTGFGVPYIGEDAIAYHLARAKGGCGLSVLEASSVHHSSAIHAALFGDAVVPAFRKLMEAVRPHGMRVFQQLWHGGNLWPAFDGGPPFAVSDIPGYGGLVGKIMSRENIHEVRQAYVDAALRCQEGGLDGVEVHACHGYLIHQFLSTFYNTREDEYGGSFENRCRFLFETVRAIRLAVSPDFVVGIRLGASEAQGGVTVDDNKLILQQLQEERLIDYVSASKGDYFRMDTMVGSMQQPLGYELPSTVEITSGATVPRMLTGRFRTLEEAEQLLRDGTAEIVSLVRAQIADPNLVRKTREGHADQVRPCIACNQGCIGGIYRAGRMGCTVNAAVGAERVLGEELIQPTDKPQKVLIVGGGPAGMEAARVSALKGHRVTLVEAQRSLGGAVNLAQKAPSLATLGDITYWLGQEIERLGVEVKLGTFMEAEDIRQAAADVVVIATGSVPRMDGFQLANPGSPARGCDLPHVISSHDLFSSKAGLGEGSSALVLDTVGHYEALAVVEMLMRQGRSVTYLSAATGMSPYVQNTYRDVPALERFYALGQFDCLLRHHLVEIKHGVCLVRPLQAAPHQTRQVKADTVVLVTHNKPSRALYDELRAERPTSIFLIGDAHAPRDVQIAIGEGHRIARGIA